MALIKDVPIYREEAISLKNNKKTFINIYKSFFKKWSENIYKRLCETLEDIEEGEYKQIGKKEKDIEEAQSEYDTNFKGLQRLMEEENLQRLYGIAYICQKNGKYPVDLIKDFFIQMGLEEHFSYDLACQIEYITRNLTDHFKVSDYKYFEWSCIDDGRSCDKCISRNGKIYSWEEGANGDYPIWSMDCQNCWEGCRCTFLAYLPEAEFDYNVEPVKNKDGSYRFRKIKTEPQSKIIIEKKKDETTVNVIAGWLTFLIYVGVIYLIIKLFS